MVSLLRNARLLDRDGLCDLRMNAGRVQLLPPGTAGSTGEDWDLEGRVVLPGLVELHTHLDKNFTPIDNHDGTLRGAIEAFADVKRQRSPETVETNATHGVERALLHGVTRLRSHVDLGRAEDLAAVEAVAGLRRSFQGKIDLQFAAMLPLDQPVLAAELFAQARHLGVDLVGGAPALTPEPATSVATAVSLARRFDCPLDLHLDETEDPASETLATLAELLNAEPLAHPATASHCCSLAFQTPARRDATLERVAAAGLAVVALPLCNLVLMGHGHWPLPRGTAPLAALQKHGITVAAGSDNVSDPFNPYGDYDPLQSAQLYAVLNHVNTRTGLIEAINRVTRDAGVAFDGNPGTLADGGPADFVVLDTTEPASIVPRPPRRLGTFKNGRVVVRTTVTHQWNTAC